MKKAITAKPQDKQIRGRFIPSENIVTRRIAGVSTRPLKLTFLIDENTPKPQILKYFEYNSTIWGGFYNLLVPTDGKTLREYWWQSLISYSPDKIIVCGEVAEDLLLEIS